MKIYNYDKETKELTTTTNAVKNPLEQDEFLIPANATTIKPLSSKNGYTVIFNGSWEYVKDFRGTTIYSTETKEEIVVTELGDIEDDFTTLKPNKYDEWKDGKWVENTKEKDKAELEQKVKAIEIHIYSNYPQKIQAQDNCWVQNFTTKFKVVGVADIESQIVGMTTSFFSGKSLDEVLVGIEMEVKPMYEKLVKVTVKNEWAYLCIQEGKKAIAENREPVYADFPKFD